MANGEGPTTGYLLWRLTMKWRAAVDRALAHLDLTHAQYSVLASLYGMSRSGARPSQRAVADHTGLEPIYISKLARALERSGLIKRLKDPDDPRAVQLSLTRRGTQVVTEAIPIVDDLQDEMTAPIGGRSSPRHQELVRTLQTLLQ
ncbi:MAG: MarR family winged helix-turn-helix transcriptional regulator [Nocardioidaceae bacterium]